MIGRLKPPTRRDLHLYRRGSRPSSLYLDAEKPVRRLYRPIIRWSDDLGDRVSMALANDNGGEWWAARSEYTVQALEHMFTDEKAPSLLYKVVGGILGMPDLSKLGYLFLQLRYVDELVEVSLEDVRVTLMEKLKFADVLPAA